MPWLIVNLLIYSFKQKIQAAEPANVLYISFCILIITALPFRFLTFSDSEHTGITPKNVEDALVILAIPMGWCYLLFFARFNIFLYFFNF